MSTSLQASELAERAIKQEVAASHITTKIIRVFIRVLRVIRATRVISVIRVMRYFRVPRDISY